MTQGQYVSTPGRLQFNLERYLLQRFVNVIISIPTSIWPDLIGLHASDYAEKKKKTEVSTDGLIFFLNSVNNQANEGWMFIRDSAALSQS